GARRERSRARSRDETRGRAGGWTSWRSGDESRPRRARFGARLETRLHERQVLFLVVRVHVVAEVDRDRPDHDRHRMGAEVERGHEDAPRELSRLGVYADA